MNDVNSFVKLKYEILTSDNNTWHLCETYPHRVRVKWALRCVKDVMHLASHIPEVATCIETIEKWLDGKASDEEVKRAADAAAYAAYAAAYAAYAATYAGDAAYAAYAAAFAASAYSDTSYATNAAKWDLYIKWLIEELADWEMTQ
jgi:hypothetical protein